MVNSLLLEARVSQARWFIPPDVNIRQWFLSEPFSCSNTEFRIRLTSCKQIPPAGEEGRPGDLQSDQKANFISNNLTLFDNSVQNVRLAPEIAPTKVHMLLPASSSAPS